jgi:hypothetical protein
VVAGIIAQMEMGRQIGRRPNNTGGRFVTILE